MITRRKLLAAAGGMAAAASAMNRPARAALPLSLDVAPPTSNLKSNVRRVTF